MPSEDQPQIYLVSPTEFELSAYSETLRAVLDAREIACFRLAMPGADQDTLSRNADVLREVCHSTDVAIVIENHFRLAASLGLDGVHLTDGPRQIRDVRKELGADAILGAYCGNSRHAGLSAGEAGADYVAFGPINPDLLGDGSAADTDLFHWWSDLIEVPVVAEGGLDRDAVQRLYSATDFFAFGKEIWNTSDPIAALNALLPRD